jgi:hypothetical protein
MGQKLGSLPQTQEDMNLSMEGAMLPPGYYLDESDPDIITLRRKKDSTFVAAFSAQGATRDGIIEAAMEDSRNLEDPDIGTAHEGEDS